MSEGVGGSVGADLAAIEARRRVEDWLLHYVANRGHDRVAVSYQETPLLASDLQSLLTEVSRLGQQLREAREAVAPWADQIGMIRESGPAGHLLRAVHSSGGAGAR
jgi:hypothetical protein